MRYLQYSIFNHKSTIAEITSNHPTAICNSLYNNLTATSRLETATGGAGRTNNCDKTGKTNDANDWKG